jgi:hypothetical protein
MGNCRLRPLPSYDRRGALKPLPQEPEHAADAGCYNMIRGYALPACSRRLWWVSRCCSNDTRCARDCHRESSMTSLPADGDSSGRAVRSLVDAFLAEDPQWQQWKGDAATLLDVGDQEDHLVVAVRKGVVTFETISRDHRHLSAEFGRELDACAS